MPKYRITMMVTRLATYAVDMEFADLQEAEAFAKETCPDDLIEEEVGDTTLDISTSVEEIGATDAGAVHRRP